MKESILLFVMILSLVFFTGCGGRGGSGSSTSDIKRNDQNLEITPAGRTWIWMGGSKSYDQPGYYGVKGEPSPNNNPGSRVGALSWTDGSGNLWLFGGRGNTSSSWGYLNDLWKYNTSTNQWVWASGSNSNDQTGNYGTRLVTTPTNVPGGRNFAVTWRDSSGNLWLFGGNGLASSNYGSLSDLWKYNIESNQWTGMSGWNIANQPGIYGNKGIGSLGNIPGARYNAVSWVDLVGNFWLFGGNGYGNSPSNPSYLNDLWKFNPGTGEWTWVNGSNITKQPGFYGTKGQSSLENIPGARGSSVSWVDSKGNLWLFGGASSNGYFNDLWKYSITSNEWTWVSGSNSYDQPGYYGTKGISSPSYFPGARAGFSSWSDSNDNLWLFGGYGNGESSIGLLNDLWKFDTKTNQWAWISGSGSAENPGNYGIKGISSPNNVPRGRNMTSVSWVDINGNFWLFGGDGDSSPSGGFLNDLWKFIPN